MKLNKGIFGVAAVAGGIVAAKAAMVFAGTGGTEFDNIQLMLTDWAQGALGKTVATGALLVGLSVGLVRQSIMGAVTGIASGIALMYGPDVISGVLTALI